MYRQVHADFASHCGRWWPVICLCLILVDSWPSNQQLPSHMLRSSTMRPQYIDLFRRLHRFVYRLHSSGTACHDVRQYRRQVLYTWLLSSMFDSTSSVIGYFRGSKYLNALMLLSPCLCYNTSLGLTVYWRVNIRDLWTTTTSHVTPTPQTTALDLASSW